MSNLYQIAARMRRYRQALLAILTAVPVAAATILAVPAGAGETSDERVLRVCADPNNLPFSNRGQEGIENRLAKLVADELGAKLEYTWWAQRRGFLRNTLYADKCDVVMGIPSSHEMVLATRAYYRSSYVFLYRDDRDIDIRSFDDPKLRELDIGVHLIGDDGNNTPPAHALTRRGMIDNVVGYMIYGDYAEENPPARLIEAVAVGKIDLAVVWGPFAGYFAPEQSVDLVMRPVSPQIDLPALPFVYSISMGVRLNDRALKNTLDEIIHRRQEDIRAILAEYRVPQA